MEFRISYARANFGGKWFEHLVWYVTGSSGCSYSYTSVTLEFSTHLLVFCITTYFKRDCKFKSQSSKSNINGLPDEVFFLLG